VSDPLDLDALTAEMSAMGLGERVDFYISGRADSEHPHSSEHIGLSYRDDVYRVWYFDTGRQRDLLTTSDADSARERFLQETIELAAGRGYGPGAEAAPVEDAPQSGESRADSVSRLLDALAKLPKYRGLSFRGLDPALQYRRGEVVVSPVIIATTMDLRIATENFAIDRVLAIFGTLGRSLETVSQHPHEREIVHLPSTVYTVGETMQVDGLEVVLVEQIDLDRDPSDPPWTTIEKVRALVEKHVPQARQRADVPIPSPGKFIGTLT
jgi:hypothetical protein